MADIDTKLKEIRAEIERDKAPKRETVRNILSWFGWERRGTKIAPLMEQTFAKHGLFTEPALDVPWIDGTVEIKVAIGAVAPRQDAMIARLGHLKAANQEPVSVSRDEPIEVAITKMFANDYSQLPVMQSDRKVEGFISWRTIGETRALGNTVAYVRDCMDKQVRVLRSEDALADAINVVIEAEFVMVLRPDAKVTGPVTTTDLSREYHAIAEPFLLIGRIESAIRQIIHAHAPLDVLKAARRPEDTRPVERAEDLVFSEYAAVIGHDKVWSKLALTMSRDECLSILERVRAARNDVMHFHPDDGLGKSLALLRNVARMAERIARAVAPRSPIH